MKPEVIVMACVFFGFIILEMMFSQFFKKKGQKKQDAIVEMFSTGILILFTQPLVLFLGGAVTSFLFPNAQGLIANWSFLSLFLLYLIFDDMTQYWWHRLSHSIPALYIPNLPQDAEIERLEVDWV